ncbi:MAG: peptidoglycan DD-metalloendopeptidase family protein [Clostridiales bacterium]|nr:peptidoglycan DD-metalloendopeptidase family protein [Clostridiales bacterium]
MARTKQGTPAKKAETKPVTTKAHDVPGAEAAHKSIWDSIQNAATAVPHKAWPMIQTAGKKVAKFAGFAWSKYVPFAYRIGLQVARLARRFAQVVLAPIGRRLYRVSDVLLLRHLRAFGRECRRIGQGFQIGGRRIAGAFQKNKWSAVSETGAVVATGVKRHKGLLAGLFHVAAPALAVVALAVVINFWSNSTFALAVEYDGKFLGYVTSEEVFDNAADLVAGRVIDENDSFSVSRTPKYTLALVSPDDLDGADVICDKIISTADQNITEATGLYIDGTFMGAVEDRQGLIDYLDSVLAPYRTDNETEKVEFVQQMGYQQGLYLEDSITELDELTADLSRSVEEETFVTVQAGDTPIGIAQANGLSLSELYTLNPNLQSEMFPGTQVKLSREVPFLNVRVTREEVSTREVAFEKETVEDDSQYTDYKKVTVAGVNGEEELRESVVYVNGYETERTLVESTILTEPVTEVTTVGTKKRPVTYSRGGSSSYNGAVGNYGSGTFKWPVAGGSISSGYGYRWGRFHKAVDIAASTGTNIYAADSGTVTFAGWGGSRGYGNYLIIDHGNGFKTLYAHCNSLYVTAGQKVSKGDVIAAVGSTGFATGPHCHFEVILNGSNVNPSYYL